MDIVGPGSDNLTVSGNNASRVFYVNPDPGADVTISGLRATDGTDTAAGESRSTPGPAS